MSNGFAAVLVKNTHYMSPADGLTITATLPTIVSSIVGDVIIVEYVNAIVTGNMHKFGTGGELFMRDSAVYRKTGAAAGAIGLVNTVNRADGTTHDFLNLTGLLNAGPGVGSYLVFSFNGVGWRAEARCTSSGTGAASNVSVFAIA
jgi:hypothetical protein